MATLFWFKHLPTSGTPTDMICPGVCLLQPLEFKAGQEVVAGGKEPSGDSAGGLFSGASGPKPPPALSQAVMGMKPGGKVNMASFAHCCFLRTCLLRMAACKAAHYHNQAWLFYWKCSPATNSSVLISGYVASCLCHQYSSACIWCMLNSAVH